MNVGHFLYGEMCHNGDVTWLVAGGGRWERYHQTKLANVVFTLAMRDKLEAKGAYMN